ncbi:hypothetical protein DY000_02060129 [Brassica cretica]|uniref:DUF4005 domain-containing protein n=1 Tax=Brassica cretica TaxID=69181 RepID=A0ABQ7B0B2_BRACR|nr:hypothetical protein DY000_02060129 [Brassica cretica]
MPSSTRSNKETQLIFSSDPASLERSIRKGRRSSSIDNNNSSSLDSCQPPSTQTSVLSTDTRSSPSTEDTLFSSTDIFHPTSIDTPEGHPRNAAGQRIDAQRAAISETDATGAAQPVDEATRPRMLDDYNRPDHFYTNRSAIRPLLGSKTVISKSMAKIIILANSSQKTSRKKYRKNTNTYGRGFPERSVRKETGQDPRTGPFSLVRLSTTVTSPMGEDDHHQGHLTHGRGRPAPRSRRPWARTTSTTVTSPMGEDDQHNGHLAHGRGRPAPRSSGPRARTIRARFISPTGEDDPSPVHLALGRGQSNPGQSDSFQLSCPPYSCEIRLLDHIPLISSRSELLSKFYD